jgi:hypothetical protein
MADRRKFGMVMLVFTMLSGLSVGLSVGLSGEMGGGLAGTLFAAPPEIQSVEGYLVATAGPFTGLSSGFEYIRQNSNSDSRSVQLPGILPRESTEGAEGAEGALEDVYLARYDFMNTDIWVIGSQAWNDFATVPENLLRWRRNTELCAGRDLLLANGGTHVALSLSASGAAYLVLFPDTVLDICRFLDIYQPLASFFNPRGIQNVPVFPGALGVLP